MPALLTIAELYDPFADLLGTGRGSNRSDLDDLLAAAAISAPTPEAVAAAVRAYLQAALWTDTDDNGEPLDATYAIADIHPDSAATATETVTTFLNAHHIDVEGMDPDDVGHQLWMSRNHHGTGFFDSRTPAADRLQAAAGELGDVHLVIGDDGKLHVE